MLGKPAVSGGFYQMGRIRKKVEISTIRGKHILRFVENSLLLLRLVQLDELSVNGAAVKSGCKHLLTSSKMKFAWPQHNNTFSPQFSILPTASQKGSYIKSPDKSTEGNWTYAN